MDEAEKLPYNRTITWKYQYKIYLKIYKKCHSPLLNAADLIRTNQWIIQTNTAHDCRTIFCQLGAWHY